MLQLSSGKDNWNLVLEHWTFTLKTTAAYILELSAFPLIGYKNNSYFYHSGAKWEILTTHPDIIMLQHDNWLIIYIYLLTGILQFLHIWLHCWHWLLSAGMRPFQDVKVGDWCTEIVWCWQIHPPPSFHQTHRKWCHSPQSKVQPLTQQYLPAHFQTEEPVSVLLQVSSSISQIVASN